MSLIQVRNCSFTYPGAMQPVFQNVNLELDSRWRLGLVGRNGRGKTTFLNLLRGVLHGSGEILSQEEFDYFPPVLAGQAGTALQLARGIVAPFEEWEEKMRELAEVGTVAAIEEYGEIESAYAAAGGYTIEENLAAELGRLEVEAEVLNRPYSSLSGGEGVKLQLAALFLKKHRFWLIDEPTDHLDAAGRASVARWLKSKQGFIVVSHDRAFLDEAIDHVLSINRADIELQKGNYSSWRENRQRQDAFERAENKKLEGSIGRLREAAAQTKRWSDKVEKSKIGGQKNSYNGGTAMLDRGYVGHQAAKMMQRSKSILQRREKEIAQKETLLKNIEEAPPLRLHPLPPTKKCLLRAEGLSFGYGEALLLQNLNFQIEAGERVALTGGNGSGKSSLLKLLQGQLCPSGGALHRMGGLVLSAVPQDTAFLQGDLRRFAAAQNLEESLFLALLRKLNFSREAFARPMQTYSAGQKKKVCLAASLAKPAHLFVWDEPLNYIDVHSREQLEDAVLQSAASLLFVEHDARFTQNVATRRFSLP